VSAKKINGMINGIDVEFWISKSFDEIGEIILECDNGDEYVFYVETPLFGPEGYRVIVNAESDILAVVGSIEDIMRFIEQYIDAEELHARNIEHIDATIR
jgi:hypothetical protein